MKPSVPAHENLEFPNFKMMKLYEHFVSTCVIFRWALAHLNTWVFRPFVLEKSDLKWDKKQSWSIQLVQLN